ncbi:MAG: response regulator transcription factor [Bacteroidia bacterium]|nr:response regulator transcription factor [Bacteroidia bacterium]
MASHIKIALVDDHLLFRQALSTLLETSTDLKIVFEASNAQELFQHLKKKQPHVILLSAELKGLSASSTITELKKDHPEVKVLVTSMNHDDMAIFSLVKQGASGFITKDKKLDEAVEAIRSVKLKGFYYTDEVTQAMLNGVRAKQKQRTSLSSSDLTERETEIIRLICRQYSMKDVAARLKLSPRTVESHKENILMKTGSKNLVGIVLYAVEHQLL